MQNTSRIARELAQHRLIEDPNEILACVEKYIASRLDLVPGVYGAHDLSTELDRIIDGALEDADETVAEEKASGVLYETA